MSAVELQRAMKPEKKEKKEIKEKKETIDTDAISGIIAEMEGLGFDKTPMYHEMATARNVVKRKKRLAALQHDVLMLDRRTMSEMRSYIRPPKVLHEVLQAALLLLGEDEKTAAVGDGVGYPPGPSFIKPCNVTRNYAVYWSQLTEHSQCSLRPVS